MKDQVEIERELASTQEALVYANKEKWKYKDRCIELEKLLKECDNELKILRMLSLPMASKEALSECDDLLSKIDNAIGGK